MKKKKSFLEECEEFETWRNEQFTKEWQLNHLPLTQENADESEQDK